MPGTSYKGLTVPADADTADGPLGFRQYTDSGPIPRFANNGARDAAIPAPAIGQVCAVGDKLQTYFGSPIGWYNGGTQGYASFSALSYSPPGVTLRYANMLVLNPVPAGVYLLTVHFYVTVTANGWVGLTVGSEPVGASLVQFMAGWTAGVRVRVAHQRIITHPAHGSLNINLDYGFTATGNVDIAEGDVTAVRIAPLP